MRYIGNKNKLLVELESFIYKHAGTNFETFCDLFSGTGSVGDLFADSHKVIANDALFSAYVMSHSKLNPPQGPLFQGLKADPFEVFNDTSNQLDGFIAMNYAPQLSERMYFNHENAARIDFARTKIEEWKSKSQVTYDEYIYLIACLLESVSKVANIAGVYGSYLKNWDPRAVKQMIFVELPRRANKIEHDTYNLDVNSLIDDISGDVLYIDPPYTINDYSVQYHLLETIAKYDSPEIKGKTGGRMDTRKSQFSTKSTVQAAFEKIIAEAKFSHIFVSYSNKGLLSKEFIERCLRKYGIEESYVLKEINHVNYTNHQSQRDESLVEYIFHIQKNPIVYTESPLNYMGSKFNIIPDILKSINTTPRVFVDVFGGGFNVGVNVDSEKVIYNDLNHFVRNMIQMFHSEDGADLANKVERIISKHGLEKANKESFVAYRSYYNSLPAQKRTSLELYVLLQYGFQQQLRFNGKHEFNNTVGMSSYNTNTLVKLLGFSRSLKKKQVEFHSSDFEEILHQEHTGALYYCDPPYLVTLGSYNDGKRGFKGWTQDDEHRLYAALDNLNKRGEKFVLSNVLVHKDRENHILSNWLNTRQYESKRLSYKNRTEIIIKNF